MTEASESLLRAWQRYAIAYRAVHGSHTWSASWNFADWLIEQTHPGGSEVGDKKTGTHGFWDKVWDARDRERVEAGLPHKQSRDCWCHPRVQVYEHADVVIHNDKSEGN